MINYKINFVLIIFFLSNYSNAQNSPLLNLSVGMSVPAQELGGELTSTDKSGFSFINKDFVKNNYANTSGISLCGALKIPFGKKGLFAGRITGSYTFFNVFRRSFLGVTRINNTEVTVSYDTKFTSASMGFGLEFDPVSGSKIRPFLYADFKINLFSMSLIKNDNLTSLFNDSFRLGFLPGVGISYVIDKEYSLVLGGSYNFGNVFLKSSSQSYNDRVVFEREGIPMNDKEGLFYTNLSDPDSLPILESGKSKNINWWDINLGINIVLGK